jgi:hypothetical protein
MRDAADPPRLSRPRREKFSRLHQLELPHSQAEPRHSRTPAVAAAILSCCVAAVSVALIVWLLECPSMCASFSGMALSVMKLLPQSSSGPTPRMPPAPPLPSTIEPPCLPSLPPPPSPLPLLQRPPPLLSPPPLRPPPPFPSPLPQLPPPPPRMITAAALNERFWSGSPSSNLRDAGVLLRQFDGQSDLDGGSPWRPCPTTSWCAQHENFWPSSVINRFVRRLYYQDRAGFALDPQLVTMLCVCQNDCNSNSQARGRRGCASRRCCDDDVQHCAARNTLHEEWFHHIDHDCSYPPEDLQEALAAQLKRGVPMHNEVVLDNLRIDEHLPSVVLAFFFMSEASREAATTMHRRFLDAYGVSDAYCPLVRLDLYGEGDPFSEAR